jgi:hypothetical protein
MRETRLMNNDKKRTAYLDFFFLTAWLMTSAGAAVIAFLWFGIDFRGYYAAARVLLEGGNPYDYQQVAEVLKNVTGYMGNNPYYYPPWFAWLFIPIAKLPFQIARAIWMVFNVVIWDISLWQLDKLIHLPPKGWKRYALFLLATIFFAWATFMREQAGVLVFAMLVAALISLQNGKWLQSGIWLALLLIKPNITLGVVAGISLWLLRKKQWQPVLTMVVTLLILLAVSTALTPNWYQPFFEPGFGRGLTQVTDGPEKITGVRINSTFLDWTAEMGVPATARFVLYGIFVCVAIILFFRVVLYSQSLLEVASLSTLIFCAVTPYALQYDYPPLVITLFWALSLPLSTWAARGNGMFVAFISIINVWQSSMPFRYWMIVGLIALVVNTLYHSPRGTQILAPRSDHST